MDVKCSEMLYIDSVCARGIFSLLEVMMYPSARRREVLFFVDVLSD